MPTSKSNNLQVAPHILWDTTISACSTALSLLCYYENGNYGLVNAALRPLQQLIELGSEFEKMKQIEKIPGPPQTHRKLRDVKRLQFDPNDKWDIINAHEIHVPLGKGEYISAILIDTEEALDAIIPDLLQAERIAIDCEFLGEKKKDPEVKCIQLAHSSRLGYTIAVDSIGSEIVLGKLQRILSSPSITRLGWAYFADARAMERLFDITIGRTLDLQAKLREVGGQTYNLADAMTTYAKSWDGYDRFMEAKNLSSSFHFTGKECVWLQRPLSPAALVYSVFDVVSLYALHDATSLHLTSPNHYWPDCRKASQTAKSSRNQATKIDNTEDQMEEFEFDVNDEDFRQLPREQPLTISEEEKQYLGDLNKAVKLSLQTEETKSGQEVSQGKKSKFKNKTLKSQLKLHDNEQIPQVDSRLTTRKGKKLNNWEKSSEQNNDLSNDDEDELPITHYNLGLSNSQNPPGPDAPNQKQVFHASDQHADVQSTFAENENVEMWKGFALKQWSMKENVPISSDNSAHWLSPTPRSPAKEATMSPNMEAKKSQQVPGRSVAGKRDKMSQSSNDNNGTSSNEDFTTADGRSTQAQLSKGKSLHPVIIQKNQAISEDDYDSTLRLDDQSSLHMHIINSPKRLKEMKLSDANRALQSPVAILGQFQEFSTKKKLLHAVQILTVTNDVYTILLDSAIPNPDAIKGTLFEHILTSPDVQRATWDFGLLAEHLETRLGIKPGKTLCLSYKLASVTPGMSFITAMNILKRDWVHMPLLYQLNHDRNIFSKRKKFLDHWAKSLPPHQLIKEGVLELKGYLDMSSLAHFDSTNMRAGDYWTPKTAN
ncbi:hypothetical protein INT43_005944 [Umbelopsis isabellina]|uniref:3'-5' exonuclease domain-containing protein n=1 Tax=Mortierella isabellina TaxID=91625 RepID=A0A8H7PJ10_MORIS|nr:hypothetical protein INT43_005944 [Umbelopsis isabellina]